MDEASLRRLPQVKRALAEARQQAGHYRRALRRRYDTEINLRTYVVVALGLERMLGEEIE